MCDLDIYDPPCPAKDAPVKSRGLIRTKFTEYSNTITSGISEQRERVNYVEQKVLSTVKPVTRFIPITYDTVKRVSVISLCTFSGVIQGRKAGGFFRRILYPVFGFVGGNAACYPKQTYSLTSKTLTTTLPLVATAGKATVDGSRFVFHTGKKVSYFIYDKVSEQFPDKSIVEEPVSDEPNNIETIQEAVLIDDSSEASEDTVSSEELSEDVVLVEEQSSSDTVISLEKLPLPTEVPPIEENLGMGDKDHDDMYSTRSSRS
ncbi:uncharacterized protein LOC134814929 [Bolinopsis microptera]|uniref:uncharacterized protein LOC134814929 n=1 Tax=Bolinopsis microptera TaxID=2820187 RepID=UPI003078B979